MNGKEGDDEAHMKKLEDHRCESEGEYKIRKKDTITVRVRLGQETANTPMTRLVRYPSGQSEESCVGFIAIGRAMTKSAPAASVQAQILIIIGGTSNRFYVYNIFADFEHQILNIIRGKGKRKSA